MTVSISLNPRLEAFINDQLKSGRFNNASEVVREGLRLLEEHELKIATLKQELSLGLKAKSVPLNMKNIKKRARETATKNGLILDD